jgi:uncharacterized protein YjbI with pentapeptide repeats
MNEELKTRLEQHKMWLLDQSKGERLVAKQGESFYNADLRYANLSYADLRYANLSYANLRYANLSYANLRYANLSFANLSFANLSYANLSYANLRYANLSYADLSFANLSYAIGFKFTPLQVVNTRFFITIFDDYVIWGCKKMTFDEVKAFRLKDCTSEWNENEFKFNKKIITEMIRYYRKDVK